MGTDLVRIDPDALVLFESQQVHVFGLLAADLHTALTRLDGLTIASRDDELEVHNGLAETKRIAKEADLHRRRMVDGLNEQVRAINGEWKRITDPCAQIEATAKRKLLIYQQAERERIAREQAAARKAQEEAARKEAEALAKADRARTEEGRRKALEAAEAASAKLNAARLAEPLDAPTGVKSEHGTTSTRLVWTFKVVDPALVPRQFLVVDEKAIRRAVAEGAREVPGVLIYEEEQLAVRTR